MRFNLRQSPNGNGLEENSLTNRRVPHPFGDALVARAAGFAGSAQQHAAKEGENMQVMEELLERQAVAVTGQSGEAAFRRLCVNALQPNDLRLIIRCSIKM